MNAFSRNFEKGKKEESVDCYVCKKLFARKFTSHFTGKQFFSNHDE